MTPQELLSAIGLNLIQPYDPAVMESHFFNVIVDSEK